MSAPEAAAPGTAHSLRTAGFGALFYTWMYGTPAVFVVALVRRTGHPYTPARAQADAFGATTDLLFVVSLVAAVLLPALGLLLSALARDRGWGRHFLVALAVAPLLFVVAFGAAGRASTPLIGHVPADLETPSPVVGCAHVCPGG